MYLPFFSIYLFCQQLSITIIFMLLYIKLNSSMAVKTSNVGSFWSFNLSSSDHFVIETYTIVNSESSFICVQYIYAIDMVHSELLYIDIQSPQRSCSSSHGTSI